MAPSVVCSTGLIWDACPLYLLPPRPRSRAYQARPLLLC